MSSIKFFYFRQLVLNKILAPDVFDYGDSKSDSWHRAIKIGEVFMVNKSPRALFSLILNRVCIGRRFKTIIKFSNLLKTVGAGKFFQTYAGKIALFTNMHQTFLNTTKNVSANKFCKA